MIRTGVSFSSYSIVQPAISRFHSFDFTLSYESLRKSSCATCQPKADKVRQTSSTIERALDVSVLQSAYWTPTMFYQSRNGTFHRVNQIGGATIYYLQVRIHLPTVSGLPISYIASFPSPYSAPSTLASGSRRSQLCVATVGSDTCSAD